MRKIHTLLFASSLALATTAHAANVPSFSISDVTADESKGVITFTISKLGKSNQYASNLSFYTVDGTARNGVRFRGGKVNLTFAPTQTTQTISVPLIDDTIPEPTQTFTAKISAVSNARLYRGTATGTITDNFDGSVTWTKCAAEGSVCTINGTARVRYGSGTAWLVNTVTGSISCDNTTWGSDPNPGTTKECDTDGTVAPPPPAPTPTPTPTNTWVSAPLQDGGWARVKVNDSLWNITGPGAGRTLVPGEIVALYFNGWGYEGTNQVSFAIFALSDGSSGRALASDLEGVAPVGTPPGLPANWWVPGLVTANKTCTDARAAFAGQPGVVQGGVYRAAMLIGTHTQLAAGKTGAPSAMWEVFATGDQNAPDPTTAHTVVTGDCLTGYAPTTGF